MTVKRRIAGSVVGCGRAVIALIVLLAAPESGDGSLRRRSRDR